MVFPKYLGCTNKTSQAVQCNLYQSGMEPVPSCGHVRACMYTKYYILNNNMSLGLNHTFLVSHICLNPMFLSLLMNTIQKYRNYINKLFVGSNFGSINFKLYSQDKMNIHQHTSRDAFTHAHTKHSSYRGSPRHLHLLLHREFRM